MKKILLLILCLFTSTILSGCVRASWFSEEQHIKIVDKIIQKKYIKEGMTYELRPLYDENDKLGFFVVDFSDDSFMYIKIQDKDRSMFFMNSLYTKDRTHVAKEPWKKVWYIYDENNKLIEQFEKDEFGNDIYYYNSHFKVAGIDENTKGYMVKMIDKGEQYIPAIKNGDMYISLILMEEIDEDNINRHHGIYFNFKSSFNLY